MLVPFKIRILSSLTRLHVIPNPYDFISGNTKEDVYKNADAALFNTVKVNGDQGLVDS